MCRTDRAVLTLHDLCPWPDWHDSYTHIHRGTDQVATTTNTTFIIVIKIKQSSSEFTQGEKKAMKYSQGKKRPGVFFCDEGVMKISIRDSKRVSQRAKMSWTQKNKKDSEMSWKKTTKKEESNGSEIYQQVKTSQCDSGIKVIYNPINEP